MTSVPTGVVKFSDLQTVFGGSTPVNMSDYYPNASIAYTYGMNIPVTGVPITACNFKGLSKPRINDYVSLVKAIPSAAYVTTNSSINYWPSFNNTVGFNVPGAQKPIYIATGGGSNGNLPYISFVAYNNVFVQSASNYTLNTGTGGGVTFIIYARDNASSTNAKLFDNLTSYTGGYLNMTLSNGSLNATIAGSSTTFVTGSNAFPNTTWKLIAYRYTQSTKIAEVFNESTSNVIGSVTGAITTLNNMSTSACYISKSSGAEPYANIDINFIAIYPRSLNNIELGTILNTITKNTGFPYATAPTDYTTLLVAAPNVTTIMTANSGTLTSPTGPTYITYGGGTNSTLPYLKFRTEATTYLQYNTQIALNTLTSGGLTYIMMLRDTVSDTYGRYFAGLDSSMNFVEFCYNGSGMIGSTIGQVGLGLNSTGSTNIQSNVWSLYAFRYTNSTKIAELFKNSRANVTYTVTSSTITSNIPITPYIGRHWNSQYTNMDMNFFALYDRSLSDTELDMILNMNTLANGFPEPTNRAKYPQTFIPVNVSQYTIGTINYVFTNQDGNGAGSGWIFDEIANTVTGFDGGWNASGIYPTGGAGSTNITGVGTVKGSWFQMQMSALINPLGYEISFLNGCRKWYICGSTDGSTWTQLDYQNPTSWDVGGTVVTYRLTTKESFNYYRMVLVESFNSITIWVREFKIIGPIYIKHPKAAVPWSTQTPYTIDNFTYTFTNQDANGNSGASYHFDESSNYTTFNNGGSWNSSGIYTGSATTTITSVGTIGGSWFQMQLSQAVKPVGYELTFKTYYCRKWYVCGSTNGSTWTLLDTQNPSSWIYGDNTVTFLFTTANTWTYIRVILSETYNSTNPIGLNEFKLLTSKYTQYPPSPVPENTLSMTLNGILYTFAFQDGNGSQGSAWIFDELATITWFGTNSYNASGIYTGAATTTIEGTSVPGPWFQVQLSQAIQPKAYEITFQDSCCRKWYVCGSTDGSTWTQIDYQNPTSWTNGYSTMIYYITSNTYTYFRVVFNESFNSTVAIGVREFKLLV